MGYVTLQNVNQFITPFQISKSAGTWAPTLAGHLVCDLRTAAASGYYLLIPITLPGSINNNQCAKLKSVDVWYKVGTAAMAGMATVTVKKQTLAADTVAVTGADYTDITLDADHDTETKRKAVASHKMTVTFDNQPYLDNDEALFIVISCEGAATSVFTLLGAQANFELRM